MFRGKLLAFEPRSVPLNPSPLTVTTTQRPARGIASLRKGPCVCGGLQPETTLQPPAPPAHPERLARVATVTWPWYWVTAADAAAVVGEESGSDFRTKCHRSRPSPLCSPPSCNTSSKTDDPEFHSSRPVRPANGPGPGPVGSDFLVILRHEYWHCEPPYCRMPAESDCCLNEYRNIRSAP